MIPGLGVISAVVNLTRLAFSAYIQRQKQAASRAEEDKAAARIKRNNQDPATLAGDIRTMMSEATEALVQRSRHDFSLVYEGSYITGVAGDIERFLDSPEALSDPVALQTLPWLMDFRREGNANAIDADQVKKFACAFEAWRALQQRLSRVRAGVLTNASAESVARVLEEISSMRRQLKSLAEYISHELRERNKIGIKPDQLQQALASALTFEEGYWETVAQGEEAEEVEEEEVKEKARPKIDEKKLREAKEFARKNRMTVQEGLRKMFSKARFVLVGEHHLREYDSASKAIADSLPFLKKEGLTHVAIEVSRDKQTAIDRLSPADPGLRDKVKEILKNTGFHEGDIEVVVKAIQAGLKVICLDISDAKRLKTPDTRTGAIFENNRDAEQAKLLKSLLKDSDKVLVCIGCAHVHKKVVEKDYSRNYRPDDLISPDDELMDIKRLGTRLVEDHGSEKVIAVRSCMRDFDIDGGILGDAPNAGDIVEGSEPVILPDDGPVQGDKRVTASDFIIVWGKASRRK